MKQVLKILFRYFVDTFRSVKKEIERAEIMEGLLEELNSRILTQELAKRELQDARIWFERAYECPSQYNCNIRVGRMHACNALRLLEMDEAPEADASIVIPGGGVKTCPRS